VSQGTLNGKTQSWSDNDNQNEGLPSERIATYSKLLEIRPHHRDTGYVQKQLGYAHAENNDLVAAEKAFSTAVAQDPGTTDKQLLFAYGTVLLSREKFTLAARFLQTAANLAPEDAEVANRAGVALVNAGELDNAASVVQRSMKLNPRSMELRETYDKIASMVSSRAKHQKKKKRKQRVHLSL
jgi:Flp pilus assembly protein TadD